MFFGYFDPNKALPEELLTIKDRETILFQQICSPHFRLVTSDVLIKSECDKVINIIVFREHVANNICFVVAAQIRNPTNIKALAPIPIILDGTYSIFCQPIITIHNKCQLCIDNSKSII